MIGFMNIVYAYICDQLLFHEQINAIELVAALVILIVAIGVAAYKLNVQAKKRKELKESQNESQKLPLLEKGE